MNWFLSTENKKKIEEWKYSVIDNSYLTKFIKPICNSIEKYIPFIISPNLISISGLTCLGFSYYLTYYYHQQYQILTELSVIALSISYMFIDEIDGIHARNTKNSSPLGELIDHICDSIGLIFMVLNITHIFDVSLNNQLFIMQFSSVIFQLIHFKAIITKTLKLSSEFSIGNKFISIGVSEIIVGYCFLILSKTIGLNLINSTLINNLLFFTEYKIFTNIIFFSSIIYYVEKVIRDNSVNNWLDDSSPYDYCYNSIWTLRKFYCLLFLKNIIFNEQINLISIISDGVVIANLTYETIISKMTERDLPDYLSFLVCVGYINDKGRIILCLYQILNGIYDISQYMNLNIIMPNINVYCCGVFDLCHMGHIQMFNKALWFGNRLHVGIHNDEVVQSYKRLPIINHKLRCDVVSEIKSVYKIYPNAPLLVDKKFIDDNNIHIVVCSDEYFEKEDDIWYDVPRQLGILKPISYHTEISTSGIIKKILHQELNSDDF